MWDKVPSPQQKIGSEEKQPSSVILCCANSSDMLILPCHVLKALGSVLSNILRN